MLVSNFKRLKPFWREALSAFLCDSVITFMGMLLPLFSVIIFDYAYPHHDVFIFTVIILVGFLLYFMEFFFNAHIDYLNIYVAENMIYEYSMECFKKIQNLPMKFHGGAKIGDLTVRMTQDIPAIVNNISQFFPQLITQTIKLGVFLFISYTFDPTITLLALAGIPLYLLETRFFSSKLEQVNEEDQENQSVIVEGIQSRLSNIRTIKAFNQQKEEARKLGIPVRKNFILSLKESLITIVNVFSNSITIKLWGTFVVWYMGYEVIMGELSLGQVVALGIYIPLMEEPVQTLAALYKETKISLVSMRRVAWILDQPVETLPDNKGRKLKVQRGEVEFRGVTFGYDPKYPIFRNFNLKIRPRSSVAFVGESGSGKSTLLNLLVRFFNPQKGAVLIDGQDIGKVELKSLRENLGIVFQETSILDGTVRENILYGARRRDNKTVIEAAKAACAHDFILSLPKSYDTRLLARGEGLSGGQRQRIAIARIMNRNPKILIFDEATSALDSESEFLIQESINRCMGERTMILVAHRLSTIKKVENIIVLGGGEIKEQGGFQNLMEKKGHFFRLYNMQFGGFQKFLELFNIEFQRLLRYRQDLTLALGVVREFEKFSRQYEPNPLIRMMEEINLFIQKQLRVMDFCSVYSRDKIAICFPETGIQKAGIALARIQRTLRGASFKLNGSRVQVHLKMKMVSCRKTGAKHGEDLFRYAHQALEAS